jgi:hypothetical protein
MPRLGPPPGDLVRAGHLRQARFGRRAGVEVILQGLAQHVAALTGDEFLDGVFRAGRHCRVTQAGDQRVEQGSGSGVGVGVGHRTGIECHRVFLGLLGSDKSRPPRKTLYRGADTPAGSPGRGTEITRKGEQARLHFAYPTRLYQVLQPVSDPFTMAGHQRILTQRGDHIPAPHRPARLAQHRQQLIRENRVRARIPACGHRPRRLRDQPGQHLPRDRQPICFPPALLDQPYDPRGLLLQPEHLGPARSFPLTQQPQYLITIHPPTPTDDRSTNPYQPAIGYRNGQISTSLFKITRHSKRNAPHA